MNEYYKILSWVDIWILHQFKRIFVLIKIQYKSIFIFIIFIDFYIIFFSWAQKKPFFFFYTFIFLLHLYSPKLLYLLDDISHFCSSSFSLAIVSNPDNICFWKFILKNLKKLIFIALWRVIWVAKIFKLCLGIRVNTFFLFSFFLIGLIKADLLLVM